PALTLRTISYLTCTASRASKKSLAPNSGSVTCSGCGFRQRAPASAASFGSGLVSRLAMPPPDHHCRQEDFAGYGYRSHAYEAACRQFFQESPGDDADEQRDGHRPGILCGIILLTLTA